MQVMRISMPALIIVIAIGCTSGAADDDVLGPPMAPSRLAVAPMEGAAHVTWADNSADERSFVLRRKEQGTGEMVVLATLPFDITQYHDATIVPGRTYVFRVDAANDAGESSSSEVVFVAP